MNIFQLISDYEKEVKLKKMPTKTCPKCCRDPKRFKLHETKLRTVLVNEDERIHKLEISLLRWRCPLCDQTWTAYPWFVVPYKRYIKISLIPKVLEYVSEKKQSYRSKTKTSEGQYIWYKEDEEKLENVKALAHTTLHRWASYVGACIDELSKFTEWVCQKFPANQLHADISLVDPRKYRSEERKTILETCLKWAKVSEELAKANLEKIFLQFAPKLDGV